MKRINLSKMGPRYNIVYEGPSGPEYWKGGNDWTLDPSESGVTQCGRVNVSRWIDYHTRRAVNIIPLVCETFIPFIYWPDVGWVVINHNAESPTAHRVHFVNTYGEGWFMQNEGSTERKLCINRPNGSYLDIDVRGQDIKKVTFRAAGIEATEFTTFEIPFESNLVHQFEFDEEPIPY